MCVCVCVCVSVADRVPRGRGGGSSATMILFSWPCGPPPPPPPGSLHMIKAVTTHTHTHTTTVREYRAPQGQRERGARQRGGPTHTLTRSAPRPGGTACSPFGCSLIIVAAAVCARACRTAGEQNSSDCQPWAREQPAGRNKGQLGLECDKINHTPATQPGGHRAVGALGR